MRSQFVPYGQAPVGGSPAGGAGYPTGSDDEKYSHPGWSWASFFWAIPFLLAVRKYRYLWFFFVPPILLLAVIATVYVIDTRSNGMLEAAGFLFLPIIFLVGMMLFLLGFNLYLGFKGRELASTSRTFSNKEQYIGFMKAFDRGALVAFIMAISLNVLFLLLGIASAVTSFPVEGLGAQALSTLASFRDVAW